MFMKTKMTYNAGERNYVTPEALPFALTPEGILCSSVGTLHEGFNLQDAPENGFDWK